MNSKWGWAFEGGVEEVWTWSKHVAQHLQINKDQKELEPTVTLSSEATL